MKKLPDSLSRPDIQRVMDEWLIGRHAERDRAILARRLFDGICLEPLAEEFGLSVAQVKRIVKKGTDRIYSHI